MLSLITLFMALIISVITDLKNRKIYNLVVFPGIAAAFVYQTMLAGMGGTADALAGFAIGLGLLIIPYLLGGIGAGDVKLLAMVGAFQGTVFVLMAAVYMALIGAIWGIIALACAKGAVNRIKVIVFLVYGIRYGILMPVDYRATFPSEANPYGVAIAGGALCVVLIGGF